MQSHLPRQVERLQYFFSPVGIHVSNLSGSNKHKRRNGNNKNSHPSGTGVSFAAVKGVKRSHTSAHSSDFSGFPVQLTSATTATDSVSHSDSLMTAPVRTTDLMAWTGSGSGTMASVAALRGDGQAVDRSVTPMSTSSMSLRSVGSAVSLDSVATPVGGSSSIASSTPASTSPSKRSLRLRRNRRLYAGIETGEVTMDSVMDTLVSYGFETSSELAKMQPWQLRVLKKEIDCIEQIYVRAFQMWGSQDTYNEMFNKVYRQFVDVGVWLELNEVSLIMKCFDARMYGYRCFVCGENEGLNELDALRLHLWRSHRDSFQMQYAMEESKTNYWAKHLPETVDVHTMHAIQAAMSASQSSSGTQSSSRRSVSIGKPHTCAAASSSSQSASSKSTPEVIDLIDSSDEDETANASAARSGRASSKKTTEMVRAQRPDRKSKRESQITNRETSVDEMILRSAQIHDRQSPGQMNEMSVDKSISPPRSHLLDSLGVITEVPSQDSSSSHRAASAQGGSLMSHSAAVSTLSAPTLGGNGHTMDLDEGFTHGISDMFNSEDFPLFDPVAGPSDFGRSVSGVFDDRSTNAFSMFEQCVMNSDPSSDLVSAAPSSIQYGHSDPFKEWSDESLFSTSF